MRHRLRRVLLALVAVLTLMSTTTPVRADDWTSKGGSFSRQNSPGEPLGLLSPQEVGAPLQLGQSASQPLVVGQYAYFLGGPNLWKIDLGQPSGPRPAPLDTKANVDPVTGQVVISHSTPSISDGRLYYATGFGLIKVLDLASGQVLDRVQLETRRPIVTSPLILKGPDGAPLVVVGDKEIDGQGGNIYLISGLGDPANHRVTWYHVGGWVTASPVPAPSGGADETQFLVAADGVGNSQGNGYVTLLRVVQTPDGPTLAPSTQWSSRYVPDGVADGFAVSGRSGAAFFVDVRGRLQSRRLDDGKPLWDPIDLASMVAGRGAIAFSNTAPAVDDQLRIVIVTLRNVKAPGDSGSLRGCGSDDYPVPGCSEPGAPGGIVAIDMNTGKRVWSRRWNTPINTDPLIWQAQAAVLFGDTDGRMFSISSMRGQGQEFAFNRACMPIMGISLLQPDEPPMRGNESWSQVDGVGTGIVVADGKLLVGVNYQPPPEEHGQSWQYGKLKVFQFGTAYDLRWVTNAIAKPEYQMGDNVQLWGDAELAYTNLSLNRMRPGAYVSWFILDHSMKPVRQIGETLLGDLQPNRPERLGINFDAEPGDPPDGWVVGVLDLDKVRWLLSPAGQMAMNLAVFEGRPATCPNGMAELAEIHYGTEESVQQLTDNNFLWIPYGVAAGVKDLEVTSIQAPSLIPWTLGGRYGISWHVVNHSSKPITTTLELIGSGAGNDAYNKRWLSGPVTFQPGDNTGTFDGYVLTADDRVTYTVRVNSDRAIAETTYDNNSQSTTVRIGPYPPGFTGDGGSEGNKVLLVPADCQPNPDLSSNTPCLNYPNLTR